MEARAQGTRSPARGRYVVRMGSGTVCGGEGMGVGFVVGRVELEEVVDIAEG